VKSLRIDLDELNVFMGSVAHAPTTIYERRMTMTLVKNPHDHNRIAFAVVWKDGQWVAERVEKGWLVRAILNADGTIEERFIKQDKPA
jgi:hypothetical protein